MKQSRALDIFIEGRDSRINLSESGAEDGSPFIVQAKGNSWIPVSVIIFAYSEEDAIERVQEALKRAKSLFIANKNGRHYFDEHEDICLSGTNGRIECIKSILGLNWEAIPFDKTVITKIAWANNDTIIS